jgi:hypothetical protein
MLLYCAICGKPWRRVRDNETARPTVSCTKCRGQYLADVQRNIWKRRRIASELATEVVRSPATDPLPDLATLMGAADAAAERALNLARTIAGRKRPADP